MEVEEAEEAEEEVKVPLMMTVQAVTMKLLVMKLELLEAPLLMI